MSLLDWHQRLSTHFAALRAERTKRRGHDAPVFAIEHGLSSDEVDGLSKEVRESIRSYPPRTDSYLVWVVYATELGYNYSGDEYWQTFEELTPGWTSLGHPHWIRDRFEEFAETFGGARPTGPWAEHFSIICWPITHAILPNDLQRQLAEVLYNIRYSITPSILNSQKAFGERIAASSWNCTSRFQKLAENFALVGQIATALLLKGQSNAEELLLPKALERIARDLDRERRGRDWLTGARKALERTRFRGVESVVPSVSTRPTLAAARDTVASLGLEPDLILRRTAEPRRWNVYLNIPELSQLLIKFPSAQQTLRSRCRVTGAKEGWLASGRAFGGTQVELGRWPTSNEPLLEFEKPSPELSYLLQAECLLRPGPSWLFRIASDGVAYEVRSGRIRPGNRYLLLAASFAQSAMLQDVDLNCVGILGRMLDIPVALSATWSTELGKFGLVHSRTISILPSGLCAANWDGDGRVEWLVDDEPCVRVTSDHDCGPVHLTLSSGQTATLAPLRAGASTFVALPMMLPGRHTLTVRTEDESPRTGQLEIGVRTPRPWTDTTVSRGPLLLDVDPPSPMLEELWDGEVSVRLRGPIGRRIQCTTRLYERDTPRPSVSRTISLDLPVEPETWIDQFDRHFRNSSDYQERYDAAVAAEVTFLAEDLGSFVLNCKREPTPLRWVVRRDSLRLLDDSGRDESAAVYRYPFKTPDQREELDAAEVLAGTQSHSDGGLYVAARPPLQRGVIIPPSRRLKQFSDLRTVPRLAIGGRRSVDDLMRHIEMASSWCIARVTGNPVSDRNRSEVIRAFCRNIASLVGGTVWEKAEKNLDKNCSLTALQGFHMGGPETLLFRRLAEQLPAFAAESCKKRVDRLAVLCREVLHLPVPMGPDIKVKGGAILRREDRSMPSHPEQLARVALQLASDPGSVGEITEHRATVEQLMAIPEVTRAARFLVLAIDQQTTPALKRHLAYGGWNWRSGS